ncbi:MAG: DUF2807 domain-containing protein [Chitinophagales bacterium]|nr:DUF2807 domain-containing protein [Chitinophagaceae bacterium]MCB9065694.1 DUF2807 domain-containing protein [Chitinophagales bacterium]
MKAQLSVFVLAFFAIVFTSCHKHVIRGNGSVITEVRSVGTFSKVVANGSSNVTIVEDDEYKVILTGYGNLINAYETRVSGDKLVLEFEDKFWNVKNDNVEIEVHTPYVDKVTINGSGDIDVHSGFRQDNFFANVSGSGNIRVTNNKYKSVNAEVNGSGNIDLESSTCESAYINISGSGEVYVFVTDFLKVNISGSGDVWYSGDPLSTDFSISGSGKVHKRN